MRHNAEICSTKGAIVFEGHKLNWRQLWQATEAASCELSKYLSQTEQEVVAILAPNSIEFCVAYLAVLHTGHIALPLDPAYKQLELDAIIEQVPSKVLVIADDYQTVISDHHEPVILTSHLMNLKSVKPGSSFLRLPADRQIAGLTFTSGTTGQPKAVPNTHANHLWNVKVCSDRWNWTSQDSLLISLPLSHWYAIVMGLAASLYHANTIYLQRWFNETNTLEALASGQISIFQHIAPAFTKLVQTSGDYDLTKLRLAISGGAPLPPETVAAFQKRFGVAILETYGSGETGRIAGNLLDRRVSGSPGQPFKGVSVKLSDQGEVMVKSPGLFPGYYLNPKATAASLTEEGYWRTGDIGELKNGNVFLKGRIQERIRRFGYTISPRDVEWAVHQHPKVKDIAVMGIQEADGSNDRLVYFLVTDASEAEIRDFCKNNLIYAWRPDEIIKLSDLPRTRTGKAKLGELQKLAKASLNG